MKKQELIICCALVLAGQLYGQGDFDFSNRGAPTHIGSLEGPLAGTNILAQMLAGPTADSLTSVGVPFGHLGPPNALTNTGLVFGGTVTVPTVPPCGDAFVKMVVWDGMVWGNKLANVPPDQLGMTDVIRLRNLAGAFPCDAPPLPFFTQSAIVPIPEPSVLVLAFLTGVSLLF